jgi:hypothetical protein
MQVETPEVDSSSGPRAQGSYGTTSPKRVAVIVVLGAAAIWGSTWIGPAAFYFEFQKVILAQGEDPAGRSVLWCVPEEVPAEPPSAWPLREVEGLKFRGPPGEPTKTERDGELRIVEFDRGKLMVQPFPPGLVRGLYSNELRTLGQDPPEIVAEGELFREVITEVPDRYEFAAPAAQRWRYAARLLTKMLLWEMKEVERARFCLHTSRDAAALLVEYACGEAKVFVSDPEGALVVLLEKGTPAEWRSSPALWLR